MKYQLVMQFPEAIYGDLDYIAELEEKFDDSLVDAEVDGHDIGNGEVNIFIHTNHPMETFEATKNILEEEGLDFNAIKIAYREFANEQYIPIWPSDLTDFTIT